MFMVLLNHTFMSTNTTRTTISVENDLFVSITNHIKSKSFTLSSFFSSAAREKINRDSSVNVNDFLEKISPKEKELLIKKLK